MTPRQRYQARVGRSVKKTTDDKSTANSISWANFWQLVARKLPNDRALDDLTGQKSMPASEQSRRQKSTQHYSVKLNQAKVIIRRHKPDYLIVLFMALLMLVGLILIYAVGPQRVNALNNDAGKQLYGQDYFFYRHLISVVLAGAVFVVCSRLPLTFWRKYLPWFLGLGFGLSALLFVSAKLDLPIAQCVNGACRWLKFGGFTLQVAEVLKFCLLIFFSYFWAYFASRAQVNAISNLVYSGIIFLLAVAAVVILQTDLGTGISMVLILLAMIWTAGLDKKKLGYAVIILTVAIVGSVIVKPHRVKRVSTYFQDLMIREDQSLTQSDQNHHINQAKIAVGSGGLVGLGIGRSVQATGYLPEALNDSIFAIIGEVFGFVGGVGILALYLALAWRLLRGVEYSHHQFSQIWFAGAFAWLGSHVFINIGSMTGLIPMTGITLPFLSYGGTSMLFVAGVLGVAFNLSRFLAHIPAANLAVDKQRAVKVKPFATGVRR